MSNGKEGFFVATLSPGMLLFITGTMRCGKTNLAVNLMGKGVSKFYHIYTNIHFFKEGEIKEAKKEGLLDQKREYEQKHQNIHLVTSASELIIGLSETRKNIVILDEAAIYVGSARGNAKIVRWFKELVTQIGKFKASMILITQVKSELAVMLKKRLPTHEIKVYRLSDKRRQADIYFVPPQAGDELEDLILLDEWDYLEATTYPFDTEAPAMFNFDIDMETFLIHISKLNSIQARKQAPIIIGEMVNEKTTTKVKTTAKDSIMAEFYNGTKLTLRGLAKKYGKSYPYVRKLHADFLRDTE